MNSQIRRLAALACALLMGINATAPVWAGAPADDLKQIEYKYYFRGKYPQAIEALQTFLARIDVSGAVALRASEFLAASHVLAGSPHAGRDVFARLIAADPAYAGPDPTVFKPEVLDVYGVARSDYASLALRNAPASADTLAVAAAGPSTATPTGVSKPIYKKWWFYAGAAAIGGIVAGLASGGDDTPPPASGTIAIEVEVK